MRAPTWPAPWLAGRSPLLSGQRCLTTTYTIGRHIGLWNAIRFCAAVVHGSNLMLVVNLRAPEQLAEIEGRLLAVHPELSISDQRLVLRMCKVNGHLLDDEGRTRGVVPVDPWAIEQ